MVGQQQFCSAAHEAAFQQEQTRLAVETLHRTHDALKAYIPTVSVEDILGPDPSGPPQPILEQPAAQLVDLASAVQRAPLAPPPPRVVPPPPAPKPEPRVEWHHFGESAGKLERGFWSTLLRWLGIS